MPVEIKAVDLIKLELASADELETDFKRVLRNLIKDGFVRTYRASSGLFTLEEKPNGDCVFLSERTRLCAVYKNRPDVCRNFPETVGRKPGYCPAFKIPQPEI